MARCFAADLTWESFLSYYITTKIKVLHEQSNEWLIMALKLDVQRTGKN